MNYTFRIYGVRMFRRHIQLHKDRIPRHWYPRRHPREDRCEDVVSPLPPKFCVDPNMWYSWGVGTYNLWDRRIDEIYMYIKCLFSVLVIMIFTMFYFILKPSTVGLTVLIPTVLAWEEMQSSLSVGLSASVSVRTFHSSSSLDIVFSYV